MVTLLGRQGPFPGLPFCPVPQGKKTHEVLRDGTAFSAAGMPGAGGELDRKEEAFAQVTVPTADFTVPTKYWHALPNGRVQCDLCPRFCKLLEGQRGLCFVRARQGDQIVL